MNDNTLIASDAPLDVRQQKILELVLALMIPAVEQRQLPSGAQVGVLEHLRNHAMDYWPKLRDEIEALDALGKHGFGRPFAELDPQAQSQLAEQLRARDARFMQRLSLEAVTCYYRDDRVMLALGMEARPPFPGGYKAHAGDLSLLEPVRRRGRIWREDESS